MQIKFPLNVMVYHSTELVLQLFGVIIYENLTWKNQIDAISKTISKNTSSLC